MLTHAKPHFLSPKPEPEEAPLSSGSKLASSLGLMVIAENRFVCPSTRDLWSVSPEGGIKRISSDEVDHGEALQAADTDSPEMYLASMLKDLDF